MEVEIRSSRGISAGNNELCEGVFLTWKDLWVSVPDAEKGGSKPILQEVTGFAQPGELLAIMGPSGCGKSTLLDALSGRLSSSCTQAGEILINGRTQALPYGTAKYVTQDDTLVATLTVGEAVYYSALLQLPNRMPESEKKQRAEMTIREMGLQEAANTRIGGWGCKGISGGQRRRVSICIEMLTRPKLLFLDEPTSGLDSATSHNVMERIASLAKNDDFRMTVLASIHQPSVEVLRLFNSLCLLASGGKLVYLGPASATNEFFSINGFPCSLQNPCDHFLQIINKDFDQDLEQGFSTDPRAKATDEVIELLSSSYKSSDYFQEVQERISGICKQDFGELENTRRTYGASFLTHCLVLTRRSFVNMYRDPGYYWFRLAVYVGMAFGIASLYYDLGFRSSSIQARGSLIMFVSTFLTIMAIGGFPSFVEEMKVFERERRNGQYGATAFTIANMVSAMPYLLLISLIPGAITFFLTNLHHGIEQFGYFAAALFCSMIAVESMMMVVASIVPNYLMGIIGGLGIMGLMVLAGGFFRLPNDIPAPFWRYPMYHISLFKYIFQGLYKNEFEGLSFSDDHGARTSGEEVLKEVWQVDMEYSKWINLWILLGMAVFYRFVFLCIIKISETVKPAVARFMTKNLRESVRIVENPVATPLQPMLGGNQL